MKIKNSFKTKKVEDVEADNASEEENSYEEYSSNGEEKLDEEQIDDSDYEQDENESDEDLDASVTESDEDESYNKTPKSEKIKLEVLKKYQESQGKRLYIRFPRTISDKELVEKAKELSPLIVNVHKPRQKYTRFCLVDFESKENRDVTLKELKKRIKKGHLEKYQIDIPRTENPEYVQLLAERKIKSVTDKRIKARLKRASKKAETVQSFTSSVLVFNLPKTATVLQIRELFPSAVDVHIRTIKGGINKDKSIAAITLPSTMEARAAVKNKQLSLSGNQLTVKFDNQKIKKKNKKDAKKIKKHQTTSKENTIQTDNDDTPKSAKKNIKKPFKNEETTATRKRKLTPTEDGKIEEGKIKNFSKNKSCNKKTKQ